MRSIFRFYDCKTQVKSVNKKYFVAKRKNALASAKSFILLLWIDVHFKRRKRAHRMILYKFLFYFFHLFVATVLCLVKLSWVWLQLNNVTMKQRTRIPRKWFTIFFFLFGLISVIAIDSNWFNLVLVSILMRKEKLMLESKRKKVNEGRKKSSESLWNESQNPMMITSFLPFTTFIYQFFFLSRTFSILQNIYFTS